LELNCCVPLALRLTVAGVKETEIVGIKVTIAVANLEASAAEVAVTVTVCSLVIVAGAVYSPDEGRVPIAGLRLQFTAVLVVPPTTTENCCVCPALRLTASRPLREMGVRLIVALAALVPSATDVAVTTAV